MEKVTVTDEFGANYSLDIPQDVYRILSALHASPYSFEELLQANQVAQRVVDAFVSPPKTPVE